MTSDVECLLQKRIVVSGGSDPDLMSISRYSSVVSPGGVTFILPLFTSFHVNGNEGFHSRYRNCNFAVGVQESREAVCMWSPRTLALLVPPLSSPGFLRFLVTYTAM
eukprot:2560099-Amphidinium_carterae.1